MSKQPDASPLSGALLARIAKVTQRRPDETAEPHPASAGRPTRSSVYRPATVTLPFGEEVQVVIKSISRGGARIDYFQNRSLPDTLHIREASTGLDTPAVVTWRSDHGCGLRFVRKSDSSAY